MTLIPRITVQRWMLRWSVNEELEGIWKEGARINLGEIEWNRCKNSVRTACVRTEIQMGDMTNEAWKLYGLRHLAC